MAMCSCDGPPHRYDPSWCQRPTGNSGRGDGYRSPTSSSPCDRDWDRAEPSRRNVGRLSAEDAIRRALSYDARGWPERLNNDCRDGGCNNCRRYADRKTEQIIQALHDAGFRL